MSLFGRIRAAFSPAPSPAPQPRRAAAPQSSRGMYTALGYRSAQIAVEEGRVAVGGPGKLHEYFSRVQLIRQSREFERDNELYGALLRRFSRYVVGNGFTLQCGTDDPDWNRTTEARFKTWFRRPETTGLLSGRRLARAVMRETLVCGDTALALTGPEKIKPNVAGERSEFRLQHFEAEQIRSKNGKDDGIDRDAAGKPTTFWVCQYGRAGEPDPATARAYDTSTILYVADPERPSSSRPVPRAQAGFPMLHRIKDLLDAEAVSAVAQSRVALAVTRAEGAGFPGVDGVENDDLQDLADDDIISRYLTVLPTATIFHGGPGDKIEGVTRTAPSGTFEQTLHAFLRILAAVLGVPLELLIFSFQGINYSQMRGLVEVFSGECEDWQELLEELFYVPTFEWWLKGEVASGAIKARPDMLQHAWIKGHFPWIDRLKEAQASGEQVDRGQNTWANVLKSQDLDPTATREQLKQEVIEAIKAAQEVEEETGVAVPYEPFCGRKAPALHVSAQDLSGTQPEDGDEPGGAPQEPAAPAAPNAKPKPQPAGAAA